MASHPIYQFYAELDGYEPKIWRRFQVSDNVTVARLGYIIQVLFEMTASHLMAIEVPQSENFRNHIRINHPDELHKHMIYDLKEEVTIRYEIFHEDFVPFSDPHRIVRTENATQTQIRRAVYLPNDKLKFNYDFGDDWWVSLTLEKVFEDEKLDGRELPQVLEGAGFGIVENCGGVGGLEDLVNVFKKKESAEYKHFSEWLGISDFDIMAFDLDDMNYRLKKILRIYKQSYEDRLMPTQQSIDLIERKYLQKKQR
jgi:Plasmid pRiA4b ORF-3-like protein.